MTYTYKDAGVDIEAGDRLVNSIKSMVTSTKRPGADAIIGGFGGLFDLKAAGYNDPLLVAATDGVGTKLRLAIENDKHQTVGIDLVAMCVNDLIVQGAEPLFFLDYVATGKLENDVIEDVVSGIAAGCKQANCALVGGETAEMPGHYAGGDYDLAGFSVGAVDRDKLLPRNDIAQGDVILGLPSSGFHSNGFSLLRKIIEDKALDLAAAAAIDKDYTLADIFLTPTRIYVKPLLNILKSTNLIKGLAHITGGGLLENIPRVLPDDVTAILDAQAFPTLPVFSWLQEIADINQEEMWRTFNCGIGMVVIVSLENRDDLIALLSEVGEEVMEIGEIGARSHGPIEINA